MDGADHVTVKIDNELQALAPASPTCCIYKVYDKLRKGNEEAYEPRFVSIGPYHHGKESLKEMEKIKFRYLQQLLKRRQENSVERYVTALKHMEERARSFYSDDIEISKDGFIEIMLLDGCFIVEVIRKSFYEDLRDANDPIFQMLRWTNTLRRDLLLLENQLPFFVTLELFNMTQVSDAKKDIYYLALQFLDDILPGPRISRRRPTHEVNHLLHLAHSALCSDFVEIVPNNYPEGCEDASPETINSAIELQEAGIELREAPDSRNLLDIKFVNGVLWVPSIEIHYETESVLRNLVAYEQFLPDSCHRYVTDYIAFMYCLLNTPGDVEAIRRKGIVHKSVGDDVKICTTFNGLVNDVATSMTYFCYFKIFKEINEYCSRRQNVWMANLRRNYFNGPWTIISFIAAVTLLLLTITQTVFSILSVV